MRAIHLSSVKPLKTSRFFLLGIAAGLIAINLNITWKSGETDNYWGTLGLFLSAVCYLIWEKRKTLSLETGVASSFLGTLLIAWVLLKSITIVGDDPIIRILLLVSALGLALLASGFQGLKQYWQELLILCFIAPSTGLLAALIDISPLTAKFANFLLVHLGFQVSLQGVNIIMPTGSVKVYPGCSGMEPIISLLGLAVLFLAMFPTDWSKKIIVPVMAIFVAFVVNGVRVTLMAILVAFSNEKTFEFWHTGDGSLIFAMISVLIFGLFCLYLLRVDKPENQNSVEL